MEQTEKVILKKVLLGIFFLTIFAFIIVEFLPELYSYFVEGVFLQPWNLKQGLPLLLTFCFIIILRSIILWRYTRWAVNNKLLKIRYDINRRVIIIITGMMVLFIIFYILIPHENALIEAYTYRSNLWGPTLGIVNTVLLYIYYIVEGILMVWMTDVFQLAGEIKSKKPWIPWGGIGLALTWGATHIFTKSLSMGIAAMIFGIVFGVLYILGKKNMWPPLLAWMLNYFF